MVCCRLLCARRKPIIIFSGANPLTAFTGDTIKQLATVVENLGGTVLTEASDAFDDETGDPRFTHCVAPIGCQTESRE